MNIQILYRSMTRHNKKIAQALGKEFNVAPLNAKTKPQLNAVDVLFVVSGIYSGIALADFSDYIKTLKPDMIKNVVLLTSSVSKKSSNIKQILAENGIKIYEEEFLCYGSFLFMKMGHPNKKDIEEAVEFAKKTLADLESVAKAKVRK